MSEKRVRALQIIKGMRSPDTPSIMEAPPSGFAGHLAEMGLVNVFETLWTREGIDLKTRSMLTIAMLIALRATTELERNFPSAVRNGVSIAELEEIIYHASAYAGFPAAAAAREVAEIALMKAGML